MHPAIREAQKNQLKKVPEIRSGCTVRVSQKVKEGSKERVQNFEGLVIKVSAGEGVEKTFTVRKIVEGVGVEKIFPFHSPNLTKIMIRKKAKVHRGKLYYMRDRSGKSARLSERHITDEERAAEEAAIQEAVDKQAAEEAKATAEQSEAASVETSESVPGHETLEDSGADVKDAPADAPAAEPAAEAAPAEPAAPEEPAEAPAVEEKAEAEEASAPAEETPQEEVKISNEEEVEKEAEAAQDAADAEEEKKD